MSIKQKIAKALLASAGWKVSGLKPQEKKFVFVVAPHTSNWDFVVGKLGAVVLDIPLRIAIKKSWFFPPVGWILKGLGAVPVDRKNAGGLLKQLLHYYRKADSYAFTVTPEGTRSFVKYWKAGFYKIASEAEVPIILGKLDYANKEVGVGPTIYPSGDIAQDFEKIMDYFRPIGARYPEKFNTQARIRMR